MYIVSGYRGGVFDDYIAEIYSKCITHIRGGICWRKTSGEEIRRTWFECSTYDPGEFAIAIYDEKILGYVFAYTRGVHGYIWICIDSDIDETLQYETIITLLSWSKHRLISERVSDARVSCGLEYSRLCRLVREVSNIYAVRYNAVLMVFKGLIDESNIKIPEDVIIRKASDSDIPGIVDVYNNAFSVYDWFSRWSIDDAHRWYSARKDMLVYVAESADTGGILGYVEGEIRCRRGSGVRIYQYPGGSPEISAARYRWVSPTIHYIGL